jgi:hypothetical protein
MLKILKAVEGMLMNDLIRSKVIFKPLNIRLIQGNSTIK